MITDSIKKALISNISSVVLTLFGCWIFGFFDFSNFAALMSTEPDLEKILVWFGCVFCFQIWVYLLAYFIDIMKRIKHKNFKVIDIVVLIGTCGLCLKTIKLLNANNQSVTPVYFFLFFCLATAVFLVPRHIQ